jgi:glycosyltransferase involved in cell wall biosynthesis
MVGGGHLEGKIRALADSAGFGGQVVIAGRSRADAVARYMRAADLLCLPSQNEGVPNVILEAFASGLRVIASRVGGIPEVLNHDFLGRLVVPGSIQDLLFAFTETLAAPPQTDAIRRHALYFSWERAASEYAALLQASAASGQPAIRS